MATVVTIVEQSDIVHARGEGQRAGMKVGFGTVDQARLATAIAELARNALAYAGGGVCTITTAVTQDGRRTVRFVVTDEGPGIGDITLALNPGFSTRGTLGRGLAAVRRLMDELYIDSRPGLTVIETTMTRALNA